MKVTLHKLKTLLILIVLLLPISYSKAQVTIGSGIKPIDGALLDLKEKDTSGGEWNSTKGLGLPRVKITDRKSLKDVIADYESLSDTEKNELSQSHTGLVVYNMEPISIDRCQTSSAGVMVWMGNDGWQQLSGTTTNLGDLSLREADSLALVKLYNATNGVNWSATNKNNWLSEKPLNEWAHIETEKNADGTPNHCGRVTSIELRENLLNGTVPDEIWDMTALNKLWLVSTSLTIDIPDKIRNMKQLESLHVGGATLTNGIPDAITELTQLKVLFASNTKNAGSLPSEIGKLINLEQLGLANAGLTGRIPEGIVNLTKLTSLNLSNNKLSGPIPDEIGNLTELLTLNLYRNELEGEIPKSLGNIKNLRDINLTYNQLTGEVPAELGNVTSVLSINLSNNKLNGISPQLGINLAANAPELKSFYADTNQIAIIPKELVLVPNLEVLSLKENIITEIPAEITQATQLRHLSLASNQISGTIYKGFGDMPNLAILNLASNRLYGGIPSELGNSQTLQRIDFSYNTLLGGELPESLGNLAATLKHLDLRSCSLTGAFPESSYARLVNLQTFRISTNAITGSLPSFLSSFENIKIIDFAGNKFTGDIPASYNNFKMINVKDFTFLINHNYLTGEVPNNIISLVNRQPSESQANENNPIRAKVCPQYDPNTGVENNTPFNNFNPCLPKP